MKTSALDPLRAEQGTAEVANGFEDMVDGKLKDFFVDGTLPELWTLGTIPPGLKFGMDEVGEDGNMKRGRKCIVLRKNTAAHKVLEVSHLSFLFTDDPPPLSFCVLFRPLGVAW